MFDSLPPGWQVLDMNMAHITPVREIEITGYPYPWSEGIFKDCIEGGYLCKVIENADNKVVAYAIVSVAAGECHLLNICVSPVEKGKGMARWLLRYILDAAITFEARECFLEVRPSNVPAIRLYETYGFAEIGRRKNYYPGEDGREDALVMALKLIEP